MSWLGVFWCAEWRAYRSVGTGEMVISEYWLARHERHLARSVHIGPVEPLPVTVARKMAMGVSQ